MNIYGNDGNLVFGNSKYEVIDQYGNFIEVKLSNGNEYRVKIQLSNGDDVIATGDEIELIKEVSEE